MKLPKRIYGLPRKPGRKEKPKEKLYEVLPFVYYNPHSANLKEFALNWFGDQLESELDKSKDSNSVLVVVGDKQILAYFHAKMEEFLKGVHMPCTLAIEVDSEEEYAEHLKARGEPPYDAAFFVWTSQICHFPLLARKLLAPHGSLSALFALPVSRVQVEAQLDHYEFLPFASAHLLQYHAFEFLRAETLSAQQYGVAMHAYCAKAASPEQRYPICEPPSGPAAALGKNRLFFPPGKEE